MSEDIDQMNQDLEQEDLDKLRSKTFRGIFGDFLEDTRNSITSLSVLLMESHDEIGRLEQRIAELKNADRWIPVSEKPAVVTRVLVYMKNNYIVIATYYKHINTWKNDCGGKIKGENIIEWRYLPSFQTEEE